MKRSNRIRTALVVAFAACLISVASHSASALAVNDSVRVVDLSTTHLSFAFDVPPGAMTSGRARALVGGVVGLISLIAGGVALARGGRTVAMLAVVLGLIGIVLSVVHLASFTGGFGTGSGRAGAILAIVFSLIGMGLGGLALSRARSSSTIE